MLSAICAAELFKQIQIVAHGEWTHCHVDFAFEKGERD